MMMRNMAKIKVIIATGVPFPDAVKAALGTSIRDFATKNGIDESTVSGLINASTPYTYNAVRDTLAATLGVEREWLDEQIAAHAATRAAVEDVA